MKLVELLDVLGRAPIIAAVRDDQWEKPFRSPAEVIFYLKANLLTVKERIAAAKQAGKRIFIHIDLTDGIGKDKSGIEYLANCGTDGIISTRGPLIRCAKDCGLLTVQRFFLFDSQGLDSMNEMLLSSAPDMIEIMPGVIQKAIKRFADGTVPIIAGGLIETKAEVTAALGCGATAVSTGNKELWFL